ncbi:DUF2637 domain-containing protein [Streptomyces chumphonensis]|uniref:DUF2637 domain-containing protein n=1 Tax=Streptomyces chumphonensis TaxID=1214925 RepID=A0A927IDI3_9ACTN|nr:DUF2637 domain-containing protein [Streptomyces chumphonensis]MBD3933152.1 DUF2637 domain-containing protein [Streptomyces chumphonensis]
MRRSLARLDAVLIQAVIAGALSFAHLHDLAEAAGQHGWMAWAYPVSVDLLLVAAWRRLRTGQNTASAWCWFLVALVASLGANIATAGLLDLDDVPAWLRILVAGWPAVAFLGGTLLAHSPAPEREEQPGVSLVPPSEPSKLPAVPDPEPVRVDVPAALVEHARKVATAHQERTGRPIDADTLRARLGVPPSVAQQLAAQLP